MAQLEQPLLSICIPTFNRCEVLDNTLKNLLQDPDFDDQKVEIIVSDNCSTDATMKMVEKYKVVKFYSNQSNITNYNFAICLKYASGKYIKLFNDTLCFKPGALKYMLEKISTTNQATNLFFYDNNVFNKNCSVEIDTADEFLKTVSFYSSWIANFGVWKEDFNNIKNYDHFSSIGFGQVDWSFQIVENSKKSLIYFNALFNVVTPANKGGYDLFELFVNKYLQLIRNQSISQISYQMEKYRLLRYYLSYWVNKLIIEKDPNFKYPTSNALSTILKKYWHMPYLYVIFGKLYFIKLKG